ncbi:MAG: 16S rRNA (guanine(527)-N(7))-methyltransferase RsmG, partial [Chloroflexota bacterium]
MTEFKHLSKEAADIDVKLTDAQINSFFQYAELLLEWNQKMSLTGIIEPVAIRQKHFLDSISCWPLMKTSTTSRVIDVGTGAGFPGLVLKILQPDMHLTLVESVTKKTNFLAHIVQELDLQNVIILDERAEAVGQLPEHREQYDWAVARAVAKMPVLAEYLLPLVKVGGGMLAQKGESAAEETESAQNAIAQCGGTTQAVEKMDIPGSDYARY